MSTTSSAGRQGPLSITRYVPDPDRDFDKRPLDFALIRRLIGYMRPYAAKRNRLLVCVVLRAIQLPCIAWVIGAVISGPIAGHAAWPSILAGACGLLAVAAFTQVTFHFRQRLALELGEAVVHDLRNEIFAHLQRMPMSFYNRTKIGRIISRMTSDCEALRIGVQDVLFVTLVGIGQMAVSAAFMLYYDWVLFSVVAAMTPGLWLINQYFRKRLSKAYRDVQESFSRMTSTLAESVTGIRVTQGFVRQEVNAEVGQTGSGKTSIVNLIARFYLPTDGLLLIDGYETRTLDADSLHRQMGIVLQHNFLFTGTVMENIRVGKPDATNEQVIDAVRQLDCLDMIEALPGGFNTQVGERGGKISLGQRQLVCFARAMLADPRIFILDEATSAVDTLTELRIQRALDKLLTHRTSFVVAHRLSTIRHADVVLVLDDGRIIERGTHEELLAHGGVYMGLCRQLMRGNEPQSCLQLGE